MLPAAAVAVGAREIERNTCSGETVLEGDADTAGILIDAAVDREGRASGRRGGRRIGHRRGRRDAPPRLLVHVVDPAGQRIELRIDRADVRGLARPRLAALPVARLPAA